MKRIMIDLDDTIVDGGFQNSMEAFLNKKIDFKNHDGYYLQELIPKERQEEFFEFLANNDLYQRVVIIKDALEVIEKLTKEYEIYICSAYIYREFPYLSGNSLTHKFDWIMKNMPFIKPANIVFCSDKKIIDCDIKIDDKVSNLNGKEEMRLLFSAYHNLNNISELEMQEKNIIRVNSWKEIEKLLIGGNDNA